jgi:hypothetical protein
MRMILPLILIACAGCVSAQRYERDTLAKYQMGYELGRQHSKEVCEFKLSNALTRCARADVEREDAQRWDMERKVLQSELERALKHSADPETPDFVRGILSAEIRRIRTRIQEKALDNLAGAEKPNRFEAAGEKAKDETNEEFAKMLDEMDAKTWKEMCPKFKARGLIMEASPCP